jgi:pimeloyl-ACP methyl ester carboxylesterase
VTEAPHVLLLDSSSQYDQSSRARFVKALTSEGLRVSSGRARDAAALAYPSGAVHVVVVRNPDAIGVLTKLELHRVQSLCLVSHPWSPADIEFVEALDLPLLVVHGQENSVTPMADAEAAVKLAPDGRLVAVTGADHTLPSDLEDLVAGIVRVHVAQAHSTQSDRW